MTSNLDNLFQQIDESEHRWKALYSSTHQTAKAIRDEFENTPLWNLPLPWGLPASDKRLHIYPSARFLHSILVGRDGEIALNHTITLLSLLEKLVQKYQRSLPKEERFSVSDQIALQDFLIKKHFLDLSEVPEFRLVLMTRNCVIHNGHMVSKLWRKRFSKARKATHVDSLGLDLYQVVGLIQVEKWHKLFMSIINKIKNQMEDVEEKPVIQP